MKVRGKVNPDIGLGYVAGLPDGTVIKERRMRARVFCSSSYTYTVSKEIIMKHVSDDYFLFLFGFSCCL